MIIGIQNNPFVKRIRLIIIFIQNRVINQKRANRNDNN